MKDAEKQCNPWARDAGLIPILLLVGLIVLLSGCAGSGSKDGPDRLSEPQGIPDAVPKVEPKSRYGNPDSYVVFGKRYHTKGSSEGHVERGVASWYGKKFHGRRTSSGERYNMHSMTAAHKTLPLPTYAKVTNLENGRNAVVKINDRGPFHGNRVIDLSYAAARKLGVVAKGTASVEVRTIDPRRPISDRGPANLVANEASPASGKSHKGSRTAAARHKTPPRKGVGAPVASSGPQIARTSARAKTKSKDAPKTDIQVAQQAAATKNKPATQQVEKARIALTGSPRRPEPKVAAAKARTGGSNLYLQVGAFGNRTNAEQLRRQLVDKLAAQVSVHTSDGDRTPLYKVHVGPFATRQKASNVSQQIASLGVSESHVVIE